MRKIQHRQKKNVTTIMNILIATGIAAILTLSGLVGTWGAIGQELRGGINQIDDSLVLIYSFQTPTITNEGMGTIISINETDLLGNPGEPRLPIKTAKILIPHDKEVKNIIVDKGNGLLLPGEYNITHGQKSIPLNYKGKISLTERNLLIYDSFEPYPGVDFKVVSTQISRGFKVLIVNLFPVQYIPKTGEVYYYPEVNLRIDLCLSGFGSGVLTCRNLPQDVARVRSMVDNPEIIETYKLKTGRRETSGNSKGILVDPADTYSYVIITNETLRDATGEYTFQTLIQSKIDKGLSATIVTVEDIQGCSDYWWNGLYGDGNPSFNDTACHIRNFIKDAYENWETEYVLLGGDGDGADVGGESGDNIIPAREFYATLFMGLGEFIASDLYYACLDGCFDSNGNGTFGEVGDGFDIDPEHGEVDLFAEVFVGRAPIDSEEELSNFVRKTLAYENSSGEQYLRDVWMIGEYLGFGAIADWGGNYKDEIKDGCDKYGYTTTGISPDYDVYTMYDKDRYVEKEHINISSYVGNDNVRIRYRLIADGYTCLAGLYIDDFEVTGDTMQLFFDDMEHGENGWIHNGYIDDWELGMPSYDLGVLKVHSGMNCWGTDLDEKYNNNCNQSLISPPINLTGITSSAELTFYVWYDIERDYDYGFVEISTDSGDTWDIIKNYTGRSWWDKEDLTNLINENDVHIINHLGHGNSFHVMKLDEPVKMKAGAIYGPCHDIENLINENYFFGYSQACFPGAFDNMDYNWNYQPYDSIVEYLVTSEHGAFAFIANTRSGIGAPDTNAPSQHFDREFFDVLYNESIRNLGWANQRSKEKNIGKINMDCIRYCYYQITLFGDPEISIKDPPMPEHDIHVHKLDAPDYHLINTTTYVNATIYNRGRNNETDLVVNLLIDDEIVDSTLILSLQSKEYYDVSFTWSEDTLGLYNVSVQVLPVPGEDYLDNNIKSMQIMVTSSPPVKVFVLDSMGTDWASGTYVLLDRYWQSYGVTPITVDYTTFNDELITYEKLVNASPDVLVISNAWYCPEFPIFHFEYTNDELDAIIRYIEEGHGLIVIADSFEGNNHRLLPLVGLQEDLPWIRLDLGVAGYFNIIVNHPLFINLSNPFYSHGSVHCPYYDDMWHPWSDDDLSTGTYVAKTDDSKSVAVVNNGLVYISASIDISPNTNDLQFLYNAILSTNEPLTLVAIANGPYNGVVNVPIQFTGSVLGGSSPYSWHWDFGDGNTSEERNATYAYTSPGSYSVNLTVTDSKGNSSNDTTTATIEAIIVDAYGPYTGVVNEPVQFNGSVYGGYPSYQWLWDFGDENTSELQNPTYSYTNIGDYIATLTVTDNKSFSANDTAPVSIGHPIVWVDDDFNSSTPGWQIDHFDNIQDGIHAVAEGGTVNVSNGTYYGNYYSGVEVDKSINLIGEDKDATFIYGSIMGFYGAVYISADYVNITGFTIRNAYGDYLYVAGISVQWSNYCNISRNNIINNKNGIDAYHSSNITISGNTIVDNDFLAISSRASSGSTISGNTIRDSQHGIYGSLSTCMISGNTIINNGYGITLFLSSGNIFSENNVTDNGFDIYGYGISIFDESFNNIFYHNNFINNTEHNALDECNNIWDNGYPSGGNYWSDFHNESQGAYDNNSDNIVDDPYDKMGGGNKDRFPLMFPWNGTVLTRPNCGDANNDEIIDVGDVVYLINYLYRDGPEPVPLSCIGDCNGDGTVDIGDVVYLINYLYRGGSKPEGCCRS